MKFAFVLFSHWIHRGPPQWILARQGPIFYPKFFDRLFHINKRIELKPKIYARTNPCCRWGPELKLCTYLCTECWVKFLIAFILSRHNSKDFFDSSSIYLQKLQSSHLASSWWIPMYFQRISCFVSSWRSAAFVIVLNEIEDKRNIHLQSLDSKSKPKTLGFLSSLCYFLTT